MNLCVFYVLHTTMYSVERAELMHHDERRVKELYLPELKLVCILCDTGNEPLKFNSGHLAVDDYMLILNCSPICIR